jgi:hypothetical protein
MQTMNTLATLKQSISTASHKPNLSALFPEFIRRAESALSRDLRCVEMIKSVPLNEAMRQSNAVYRLPVDVLEVKSIMRADGMVLKKIGLEGMQLVRTSTPLSRYYLMIGGDAAGGDIEIRRTPAPNDEFVLTYFGRPKPLLLDSDTTTLLENHEDLYLQGALEALYQHTQDTDNEQICAAKFSRVIESLNEQAGRYFGGTPTEYGYNFGIAPTSSGY